MLKIYFIALAILSTTGFVASGQAPSFVWAQQGSVTYAPNQGGTAYLVTDTAGNSYVGGAFPSDTIRFGNFIDTISNTEQNNMYLVKYDKNGNALWLQQPIGLGYSQCNGVALNAANGKLYVTGFYGLETGSGAFGSFSFPMGWNCSFVAQLDAATGHVDWLMPLLASDNWADVYTYAVATSGNRIYITGLYENYGSGLTGSLELGNGLTLTDPPAGNYNMFLVQYDENGNAQWYRWATGSSTATEVITDNAGNPYIAGIFNGSLKIGTDSLSNGNHCPYLAKYDTAGNFLWIQTANNGTSNGAGYNNVTGIAKDASDNIYLTGYFSYTIYFATHDSLPVTNTSSVGNYQAFVAKYDANGNVLWAKNMAAEWGLTAQTPAIATDAANNFYLEGTYQVPIRIGTDSLTPYGPDSVNGEAYYYEDIFVAKYDSMGNPLWAKGAGGDWVDWGLGIGVDAHENEYISGDVTSDTSYFDNVTIYSPAGYAIVTAKLGSGASIPPPVAQFSASADTVCAGSAVSFTNLSTGSPAGLNWTLTGGSPDTSTAQNPTVVYNDSGTYAVKLVVNNSGGTDSLVKMAYITVFPTPVPVVTAADSLICSGDSAQVCASGGSTYVWNTSETSSCTYASNAGGYWVTATSANGCTAVSGHQEISVYPVPSVSIIVQGDTLSSFGQVSYQWMLNNHPVDSATGPVYVANVQGSYTVEVSDSNGCTAISNQVTVTGVKDLTEDNEVLLYPNPSVNSWWLAVTSSLLGSEVEVYDEEGQMVWKSEIRNRKSEIQLDVAQGVYYLLVKNDRLYYLKKMVKE